MRLSMYMQQVRLLSTIGNPALLLLLVRMEGRK